MGLFDQAVQNAEPELGDGILEMEYFEEKLLKELFGDDARIAYRLKDIGIDIKKVDGHTMADLYSYKGEEVTVCPEPIRFIREYDDVSDRTELAQDRFARAVKEDQRFRRITLGKQPCIQLNGRDGIKVWRGKTYNGINLRPGICSGKTTDFEPVKLGDDNVHGLIVGRTGAGKSVFINALLISLISEYAPWELDLYLADFKKVELSRYMNDDVGNNGTPFTPHVNACAATSEIRYVLSMFRYLADCMHARNEMFTRLGVTKIKEFREKYGVVLPRVLLVIDEFQQLFTEATARESEEIQAILNAITKLGRATGFHLIFASQEMSGTLRGNTLANFKIRMALPCNREVSAEYLGNGAAGNLERGYVLINTEDGNEIRNKKFKVPYIATETKNEEELKGPFYYYLDQIKKCGRTFQDELAYKYSAQKYYQEDLQEKEGSFGDDSICYRGYLNDLWRIRARKNDLIHKHDQFFDAVVLGKTVTFTNKKNDKSSFYIEYGRNRGIMIASPYPDDVAKIRKLLTANLVLSDQNTTHLGMELNGLVYNRFQAEAYINSVREKYDIHTQNYYGLNLEEGMEYLHTVYLLRKNALTYLNDLRNAGQFEEIKECLEDLHRLLLDEEAAAEYEDKMRELEHLAHMLEEEKQRLHLLDSGAARGKRNPFVLYLEEVNQELVTSPEPPKENHLVCFSKLEIYQELIETCVQCLDLAEQITGFMERISSSVDKRMQRLGSLSPEVQDREKVILVRLKCLYNAMDYFLACYLEREAPASKQASVYEAAYSSVAEDVSEYKIYCAEAALQNKEAEQCRNRIEELTRRENVVKSMECAIENVENQCSRFIGQFTEYICTAGKIDCNQPRSVFAYGQNVFHWEFVSDKYSGRQSATLFQKEWNTIKNLFMKRVETGSATVKDLDKYIFWLNGLDELNRYPSFLEEIIRNSINTNILFVAMITSELKDPSVRKAFDYAFVTGNIERFYDMFDIKYTKQMMGAITVNFGIRSKGLNLPFKMYRTELDVVETPNFINELLEELL